MPSPRDDELLVRVHAATVNRTDCGYLLGKPFVIRFFGGLRRPRCVATGTDFAGRIEAVGQNVTRFKVGDRIWGFDDNGLGSHAQWLTIRHDKAMAVIPEGVSYEEAASSAEGAHYAINFINKVPLQPGHRVLVNGATGAIGSAAVQLLKQRGASVAAVCRGVHAEAVRRMGADHVVDYLVDDFVEVLAPQAFDFVFDAVGKGTFGRCKRLLKRNGIYISSELGPRAQNVFFALAAPLLAPLSGGKKVVFPLPVDPQASLNLMNTLLEQRTFSPLIDKRYPMESITDAFTYVLSGDKVGNVVVTMH